MENTITAEQLTSAGFVKVAEKLKTAEHLKRKLAIAYEHYRYVRQEYVNEFNSKLKAKTLSDYGEYSKLDFCPVESWEKVPPQEVLLKAEEALGRKCFDSFEVAYIRQVADPILFGRIQGCPDRFFIAEWDSDIKITDLLKDNEG